MKILLYKLGNYLSEKFCPHTHKKVIRMDHQDRYFVFKCRECGKEIYEDF